MDVSEVNHLLDFPEPCSHCPFPAHTLFFTELPPPEGVRLAIRQVEAKCINHLGYEDMMVPNIPEWWA